MAFVLKKEHTFDYTVRIFEPEKCKKVGRDVTFSFLTVPPEEVDELLRASVDARKAGEQASFDRDLCLRVVKGWKSGDILDEVKQPVEFSEDTLSALVSIPFVRAAIIETYLEAVRGKARQGN